MVDNVDIVRTSKATPHMQKLLKIGRATGITDGVPLFTKVEIRGRPRFSGRFYLYPAVLNEPRIGTTGFVLPGDSGGAIAI